MTKFGPLLIYLLIYAVNANDLDIATNIALVCMYLYGASRGMAEHLGDYAEGYRAAIEDVKKICGAKP
jgi:hypothetical protein